MNVAEFIEKLKKVPNQEAEVCFADFIPVRAIYPCQLGSEVYCCITDNEMFTPENSSLDIDEQIHEQQEFDRDYAEVQAEMYEGLLGGF